MSQRPAPTAEQKRAADPSRSIWVSANAGSGKTQVLVERVIRLLLDGAKPDSLLCITYTTAAAAEMSARLFQRLSEWTALSDAELGEELTLMGADGKNPQTRIRARSLFTEALETPGGLKIQTIHAFCERLLHLFPVEAGLVPGFAVMDERQSQDLQRRITDDVMAQAETDPDLQASFRLLAAKRNEEQFDELITSFVAALRKSGIRSQELRAESLRLVLNGATGLAASDNAETATHALNEFDRDAYRAHVASMQRTTKGREIIAALKSDAPSAALMNAYLTKESEPRKRLLVKAEAQAHPELLAFLEAEQARIHALALRRNTNLLVEANSAAYLLASAIHARMEQEKRRLGLVDFADLIAHAAVLLSDSAARDWVRFKLDGGLNHILLDESQDTGPDQWRIILSLTEEFFSGQGRERDTDIARTLFIVGDAKQSIYSFQGADAEAYARAQRALVGQQHLTPVDLQLSFRSTDQILLGVDTVFYEKAADGKQIRHHAPARTKDQGIVELAPLFEEAEDELPDVWTAPVDRLSSAHPRRQLARQLAQRIKSWLDPTSPRKLAGRDRAITAGDILILFRTRNELFRMVLAELRAAGVPVAGADRLQLQQSLIVQDVLALLSWLILPQDDYALACVLKSPLVPEPLSEEALFTLAHDRPAGGLYARVTGENAHWLHRLRQRAAHASAADLIAQILGHSRKHIHARLGVETVEASNALLDLAMDHEREGGPSLFAFLRWMESGDSVLKRELDKQSGAVRLMTVHGAKGLEAPIVIIAEATQGKAGRPNAPRLVTFDGPNKEPLPLWLDSSSKPWARAVDDAIAREDGRAEAESRRLLYVAMTRAADELYIYGTASKSLKDSWWPVLAEKLGTPAPEQPLRFGAADQIWPLAGSAPPPPAAPAPGWLIATAKPEAASAVSSVTALARNRVRHDPEAARLGRAAHRLLEELADMPEANRPAHAAFRSAALGVPKDEARRLAQLLSAPDLKPFLGNGSRAEVEIYGALPNGQIVSGRLDRLAVHDNGIWLLDYKTDRNPPKHTLPSHAYARQMAGYTALLARAYPGRPVTAALFWANGQGLEILPEATLTAALQEVERGAS